MIGVVTMIVAISLTRVSPPLDRATEMSLAHFAQVRSIALANTEAYRIRVVGTRTLAVDSATTCGAATWTAEPELTVELPREVRFATTSWQACFNSKGLSDGVVKFELVEGLNGGYSKSQGLELLLGGSVRRVP